MTKHVTLFGRKMREGSDGDYRLDGCAVYGDSFGLGYWRGECQLSMSSTRRFASPHAAARALERKIVAAHRRLGKLMGGKK